MFKKILSELYQRVVVAYKTTLIGIALVVGEVVAQQLLASNNVVVHTIAVILGAVLVFLKKAEPTPTPAAA